MGGNNGHAGTQDALRTPEAKSLRVGKDCQYDHELRRLHRELVKFHEWIRHRGLKVVVLFEGRDAAGKGGAIKRITQELNPHICRVAGEMVLFDRSWYNRAGVERVMGFCTEAEYQ